MKIFTCEHCHFTFRYPLLPAACPDCGRNKVRPASEKEVLRYRIEQQVIADEISAGMYAAADTGCYSSAKSVSMAVCSS